MRYLHLIVSWTILAQTAQPAHSDEKITLREKVDPNRVIASTHSMKAEGTYFLDPPPAAAGAKNPEKLDPETLKVAAKTRMTVQDRWRLSTAKGGATAAGLDNLRWIQEAETEIGGDLRPTRTTLRPVRKRLLIEIENELPQIVSIDGPLTRSELEAITAPGDAATLWTLLPKTEVARGEKYRMDRIAAKSLTLYDAIATNALEGEIMDLSEKRVRIGISGEVRGAVLGAEGTMKLRGELIFDREAGLVSSLSLDRDENRRPGSVEAGLAITSRVEVTRSVTDRPADELAVAAAAWPGSLPPEALDLEWFDPTGAIRMEHDRDWHVTWSDTDETVFKRVDSGGAVIAQCNLKRAPRVAAGRHQDPEQFKQDVREALGGQFRRVFGEGELKRAEGQGYGYKLAVEGVVQELPVVWYYYLMASPEGDQYVATVTTTQAETLGTGKPGLLLAESLRWTKRAAEPAKPSP